MKFIRAIQFSLCVKVIFFLLYTELKSTMKNDVKKISDLQHGITELESTLEKKKRLETEANERISKLQKSLNEETSSRITLENNMREIDARHRRGILQIREEKEQEIKEKESQVEQLQAENMSLINQLGELNVKNDYSSVEVKDTPAVALQSRINGSMQMKPATFVPGNLVSFSFHY